MSLVFDHEPTLQEVQEALGDLSNHGLPLRDYVEFIVPIRDREKVWRLYMMTDGRVQMMHDDHARHEAAGYRLETELVSVNEGIVLFKATFETPLYGTFVGYATGIPGGRGADRTNPYENAETSAVGRVLGFAGYGIIPGSGIASAEEVQEAQTRPPADQVVATAEGRAKPTEEVDERAKLRRDIAGAARKMWPFDSWAKELARRMQEVAEAHGFSLPLDERGLPEFGRIPTEELRVYHQEFAALYKEWKDEQAGD